MRFALVKTPAGNLIRRAIQTLYPLELQEDTPECVEALREPTAEPLNNEIERDEAPAAASWDAIKPDEQVQPGSRTHEPNFVFPQVDPIVDEYLVKVHLDPDGTSAAGESGKQRPNESSSSEEIEDVPAPDQPQIKT